jgi:hypothetical protein
MSDEQTFAIDTALIETFVEDLRVRVVTPQERVHIASYLEALAAAYLQMQKRLVEQATWQPLHTAPHGQLLLIACSGLGSHKVSIACRDSAAKQGRVGSGTGFVRQDGTPLPPEWRPTSWMPLPAPPSAQDPRP